MTTVPLIGSDLVGRTAIAVQSITIDPDNSRFQLTSGAMFIGRSGTRLYSRWRSPVWVVEVC